MRTLFTQNPITKKHNFNDVDFILNISRKDAVKALHTRIIFFHPSSITHHVELIHWDIDSSNGRTHTRRLKKQMTQASLKKKETKKFHGVPTSKASLIFRCVFLLLQSMSIRCLSVGWYTKNAVVGSHKKPFLESVNR